MRSRHRMRPRDGAGGRAARARSRRGTRASGTAIVYLDSIPSPPQRPSRSHCRGSERTSSRAPASMASAVAASSRNAGLNAVVAPPRPNGVSMNAPVASTWSRGPAPNSRASAPAATAATSGQQRAGQAEAEERRAGDAVDDPGEHGDTGREVDVAPVPGAARPGSSTARPRATRNASRSGGRRASFASASRTQTRPAAVRRNGDRHRAVRRARGTRESEAREVPAFGGSCHVRAPGHRCGQRADDSVATLQVST